MDKLDLVIAIGDSVCEGCSIHPDECDCGLESTDCDRIDTALNLLDEFLKGGDDVQIL